MGMISLLKMDRKLMHLGLAEDDFIAGNGFELTKQKINAHIGNYEVSSTLVLHGL